MSLQVKKVLVVFMGQINQIFLAYWNIRSFWGVKTTKTIENRIRLFSSVKTAGCLLGTKTTGCALDSLCCLEHRRNYFLRSIFLALAPPYTACGVS